jgi:nucleotide-binding universal stress UspA family protein
MKPTKTILHPTDFSEASQQALGLACAVARQEGARLVVLHVVPPEIAWEGDVSELPRTRRYEQDLRSYREEMKGELERLPLPGLPVRAERRLGEGNAAAAILEAAREVSCDLIVMGTHGRTAEARRLMGGVAEEVAHKAACPVVTVRVPLAGPKPGGDLAEEAGLIL